MIWEPVAGDGAIARPLLVSGFMVDCPSRMSRIKAGVHDHGGLQTMSEGTFAGPFGNDEKAPKPATSGTATEPGRAYPKLPFAARVRLAVPSFRPLGKR